jgi:hypothetical protein
MIADLVGAEAADQRQPAGSLSGLSTSISRSSSSGLSDGPHFSRSDS